MPEIQDFSLLTLPDSWLKQILEILGQMLSGREVWLYGSRVNGCSYEASDVDLVFFPKDKDDAGDNRKRSMDELDLQLRLKAAFKESNIPLFVDILSWDVIPESFHEQILEQNYLVVQKGGLL